MTHLFDSGNSYKFCVFSFFLSFFLYLFFSLSLSCFLALFSFSIFVQTQAEDLLDDILSFESSSLADSLKLDTSCGAGGISTNGNSGSNSDLIIKQEPSGGTSDAEMHAMAKDRQKKDNHNMSMAHLSIIKNCFFTYVSFALSFCF